MDYKMIKIYEKEISIGKDKYNLIIKEKWSSGWGKSYACGRTRPKFYEISKNGKTILFTTLHQTFNSKKRKLENGIAI